MNLKKSHFYSGKKISCWIFYYFQEKKYHRSEIQKMSGTSYAKILDIPVYIYVNNGVTEETEKLKAFLRNKDDIIQEVNKAIEYRHESEDALSEFRDEMKSKYYHITGIADFLKNEINMNASANKLKDYNEILKRAKSDYSPEQIYSADSRDARKFRVNYALEKIRSTFGGPLKN